MGELEKPKKPVVLVLVGYYLPGFKAGGILRSVVNLVDWLGTEMDILIVTRDRDISDLDPYDGIVSGVWYKVGSASVMYLEPSRVTFWGIAELLSSISCDFVYLNSFFDPLTVYALAYRKFLAQGGGRIIIAPRGEFAWASFRQKIIKKLVFVAVAHVSRLISGVQWHASSEYEAGDIKRVFRVRHDKMLTALDLPSRHGLISAAPDQVSGFNSSGRLRVVFLSRISREKNLDYALKILSRVRSSIVFDIIGPCGDSGYWAECKALIEAVPRRIEVRVLGPIPAESVINTLKCYDLLFFPSGGENFGHVIVEALSAGTPVLISTNTPWRNLQESGWGWDLPLARPDAFCRVIDELSELSLEARLASREEILTSINNYLRSETHLELNRNLFKCEEKFEFRRRGPAI